MKIKSATALLMAAGLMSANAAPVPDTVDAHVLAAQKAAGLDFPGTLEVLCIQPADGSDPAAASSRDWVVPALAGELPDALRTPFEIPLAQLLAFHLAVGAGVDPDNPSPKGTITRVVRPFRIHPEIGTVA